MLGNAFEAGWPGRRVTLNVSPECMENPHRLEVHIEVALSLEPGACCVLMSTIIVLCQDSFQASDRGLHAAD